MPKYCHCLKKDDVLNKENYRPVAILSPLSKILERVYYNQLYQYFDKNKLFHKNHHGFRKNRSTQTALLQLYDRWIRAANNGKINGVILLDLSAAFDLVDAELLCMKLKEYGLDTLAIQWIKSYLEDRFQAVWINHTLSDWIKVDIGVPQGSILGPLMFILFANDLPDSISSELDAYADDSTMTESSEDIAIINQKLTESCEGIKTWMTENKLCLNAGKTKLLVTGTSKRLNTLDKTRINIKIDGENIKPEENEKLLGCYIQSNLKWTKHISELLKKLKTRLTALVQVKNIAPLSIRKMIYEGIFNSVLTYCIAIWGGLSQQDLDDLQVIQNKAIRVVLKKPPRTNRNEMFDQTNYMTVRQLVVYHTLLNIYKIRLHKEPEYLYNCVHRENIRQNIVVEKTELTLTRKGFIFRGAENWNSLPMEIRNIDKIGQFKPKLKQWLLKNVKRF